MTRERALPVVGDPAITLDWEEARALSLVMGTGRIADPDLRDAAARLLQADVIDATDVADGYRLRDAWADVLGPLERPDAGFVIARLADGERRDILLLERGHASVQVVMDDDGSRQITASNDPVVSLVLEWMGLAAVDVEDGASADGTSAVDPRPGVPLSALASGTQGGTLDPALRAELADARTATRLKGWRRRDSAVVGVDLRWVDTDSHGTWVVMTEDPDGAVHGTLRRTPKSAIRAEILELSP